MNLYVKALGRMTPKELIDAAIAPLSSALRQGGFRKAGRRFHKDIGEARVFLEVQASQWNRDESAKFTVNLAVYAPEILRRIGREVGQPPKSEVGCTWHERIGFLTPARLDLWGQLDGEESIEDVSNLVLDTVHRYGVPWLEAAASYEGFCEVLSKSVGIPAADMLWSLGLREEAVGCVRRMPQNTSGRAQAAAEWFQSHEHALSQAARPN